MGWGECVKKVSELPISEVLVCVSVKCTVPCHLYGMDIIMSLIRIRFKQCCGSGSVFRIFVDPDPYSQYGPGFTEENI